MTQVMNRAQRRQAASYREKANKSQPAQLREVPAEKWPYRPAGLLRVWQSQALLVQLYQAPGDTLRLSINRATIGDRSWNDRLTWDELQQAKAECGFADRWAVEVYPPDAAVVNVANMRHLWLLTEAPPFAWNAAHHPH